MSDTGNPGRLVIGTVPVSLPSAGTGCTPSCCYTGHHSHMQIANIAGVTAAASISCGASVIGG